MVARGCRFLLFTVGMISAQVASAQPAHLAPGAHGAHGGVPVERIAAADPVGDDLFALDPGAADPAAVARPDGDQRMGRRAGMRGGQGMGERRGELARELKLSGEQREKLAGIRERQMRRSIQARADLALERLELRKLLHAETPSLTAVGAQIDKIARTCAESAKSRVASLLEMRNVLTAEQRKLLRDRRGVMGGRGMERRFRGNGGGQGMSQEGETE